MMDQNTVPRERPSAYSGDFDTTENYPAVDTTTEKAETPGQANYPSGTSRRTAQAIPPEDETTLSGSQRTDVNKDEDIEIHDWGGPDDPENPLADIP